MHYLAIFLLLRCIYAGPGGTGSSIFWPSLATQCTTALNILSSLNVTYKQPNSVTCCFNGDKTNPTGNFPAAGVSEKGVYIGCSVDGQNRQFITAM